MFLEPAPPSKVKAISGLLGLPRSINLGGSIWAVSGEVGGDGIGGKYSPKGDDWRG